MPSNLKFYLQMREQSNRKAQCFFAIFRSLSILGDFEIWSNLGFLEGIIRSKILYGKNQVYFEVWAHLLSCWSTVRLPKNNFLNFHKYLLSLALQTSVSINQTSRLMFSTNLGMFRKIYVHHHRIKMIE